MDANVIVDLAFKLNRKAQQLLTSILYFIAGLSLYVIGVYWAFWLNSVNQGPSFFNILVITLLAALVVLVFGYMSVVLLGGRLSLWIAEFSARLTNSKQCIEVADERLMAGNKSKRQDFLFYFPFLVFIISVALGWDIHNIHGPIAAELPGLHEVLHSTLHSLDVFVKPSEVDSLSYSISIIPVMFLLIIVAGIVPSIVLPYFRRFKITAMNSRPFHIGLLTVTVGFITGLGVLLSIIGFLFNTMWVNAAPTHYRYILPTLLGLSIHYSLGSSLGRERSEHMVKKMLDCSKSERVIQGRVRVETTK